MPDPKDTDTKKRILIVGDIPRSAIFKMMDRMEKEIFETLSRNPNPSTHANQSSASSLSKEDILEQIKIVERMLHEKCGLNDATPSPDLLGFHNFNKPIAAFPSIPFTPSLRLPLLPPIHVNHYLTEQFRFPTSKKRRIRKKWRKDTRNFRPSRSVYVMGTQEGPGWQAIPSGIFCHPVLENEIRKNIAKITDVKG